MRFGRAVCWAAVCNAWVLCFRLSESDGNDFYAAGCFFLYITGTCWVWNRYCVEGLDASFPVSLSDFVHFPLLASETPFYKSRNCSEVGIFVLFSPLITNVRIIRADSTTLLCRLSNDSWHGLSLACPPDLQYQRKWRDGLAIIVLTYLNWCKKKLKTHLFRKYTHVETYLSYLFFILSASLFFHEDSAYFFINPIRSYHDIYFSIEVIFATSFRRSVRSIPRSIR